MHHITPLDDIWELYMQHPQVCTDTRKLQQGDLFFALKGPNFDGNQYALAAIAQGAAAAIVDDPALAGQDQVYVVADALTTLQQLARRARQAAGIRVLAITGSNGKTTTKELIAQVLAGWQTALVTPGNYNNHIGLPLTLLQLRPAHTVAVLEMGDNHPGEIAELCHIAQPSAGLITNVGLDHLEGYGSFEANVATKLELFDYLAQQGGDLLVNTADAHLAHLAPTHPRYSYGPQGRFRVAGISQMTREGMVLEVVDTQTGDQMHVHSHLTGQHNAENILACIAACTYLGVPRAEMLAGIAAYVPRNNRSQLLKWGDRTVLLDAYNANPSSMEAAIGTAFELAEGPILLVLGDMLELGDFSTTAHATLATQIEALSNRHRKAWHAILVGSEMGTTAKHLPPDQVTYCSDISAAAAAFAKHQLAHKFILLKGSRGIALEKLLPDSATNLHH